MKKQPAKFLNALYPRFGTNLAHSHYHHRNSVTVEIPRMQIFHKTRDLTRAGRLVDSTYTISLSCQFVGYLAIS
jgi:hypothetical protein